MAVSNTLSYASIDDLHLDPLNPRLGRTRNDEWLDQAAILGVMREWKLEELGVSYLEGGGFWPQEALLVVNEPVDEGGEERLVVVEGNRRLAALLLLRDAYTNPRASSITWQRIAESAERPSDELFERVPYLLVDRREDVDAFLGFRHVTGIKEWHPAEKASYIARLIEDRGFTYEQVMRKIGSKTPTVRQNYIAFGLKRQIADTVEDVDATLVEQRFSVMYLSLRTKGVQRFLGIDPQAAPEQAKEPASEIDGLSDYAVWLFGTNERPPLFTDSRLTDRFGQILENDEAVDYLRRNPRTTFDVAFQLAGGDEPEIVELLRSAADNIELALARVHLYRESDAIQKSAVRVVRDAEQLERTIFSEPAARATHD